jgi:hypothetical protein
MFGFIYTRTVAIFPSAIFFLSASLGVVSFTLVSLVRLPEVFPGDNVEDAVAGTLPMAPDETLSDLADETHTPAANTDHAPKITPPNNALVDI